MYYRYKITKFERNYYKIFGYYPSYFIINNTYLRTEYFRLGDILSFKTKISYDKDENINLIMNRDEYNGECWENAGELCCQFCCVSSCICCRMNNIGISDLFNTKDVMSTNFKESDVFNLIEKYKQKLERLLVKTKDNEWKINETTSSLEEKNEIIDVIMRNRLELEEQLESEPLVVIKALSGAYEKEKLNKKTINELTQKHSVLLEENKKNKREIYICREKINELYKYCAKRNYIK